MLVADACINMQGKLAVRGNTILYLLKWPLSYLLECFWYLLSEVHQKLFVPNKSAAVCCSIDSAQSAW